MTQNLSVRRLDGTEEAFNEERVAESILHATEAVGHGDREVARELAGVVSLFLSKRSPPSEIHPSHIEDMVERVLLETGHVNAARAYIRRRQARQSPPDPDPMPGELFPGSTLSVLSADGGSLVMWDRGRISDALSREAALSPDAAHDIARAVEEKILRRNIPFISSDLIRSLVDAELFDRGHIRDIPRQAMLGMPAYDLRHMLSPGGARTPAESVRRLAETAFRQFAFREVFSETTAGAHARSEIHIEGASAPAHLSEAFVSLEYIKRFGAFPFRPDGDASPPTTAVETAAEAGRLAGGVRSYFRDGFDLGYLNLGIAPFLEVKDDRSIDEAARHLWGALAAASEDPFRIRYNLVAGVPDLLRFTEARGPEGRKTGRGIGEYWTAADKFTRAFVRVAAGAPAGPNTPGCTIHVDANTFKNPSALSLLRFMCKRVGSSFAPAFVFEREPSWMNVHSRHLVKVFDADLFRHPERMRMPLVQTVAVNLVRPALAAGRGQIDTFCTLLEAGFRAALAAHEEKRSFIGRIVRAGMYDALVGPAPDGVSFLDPDSGNFAISVTGLAEALTILARNGNKTDAEALQMALSALSYLLLQTQEEARNRSLHLTLGADTSKEARNRFAMSDAAAFPALTETFSDLPYGAGLWVEAIEPHDVLERIRRVGARYALVESSLTVAGLLSNPENPPEVFFDMVCEVFENTDLVFLRFL